MRNFCKMKRRYHYIILRIQNIGIVLAVITIIINYPQRRKEPGMS